MRQFDEVAMKLFESLGRHQTLDSHQHQPIDDSIKMKCFKWNNSIQSNAHYSITIFSSLKLDAVKVMLWSHNNVMI